MCQNLADFLDTLLNKMGAMQTGFLSGSGGSSNIHKQIDTCLKLQLKIVLVTLNETESFGNTEKMAKQGELLTILQTFVVNEKARQVFYWVLAWNLLFQRIREAASHYVQSKLSKNVSKAKEVEKVMEKNLSRLLRWIKS
jgi:hypothetical protein